ncbi:MAG: hypothetical protein ACO3IB_10715 [Phycisphaerales bacterium]
MTVLAMHAAAHADIGFPAAVQAARAQAPALRLIALRQRLLGGVPVYECDLVADQPVDATIVAIHRDTGALVSVTTEAIPPDERPLAAETVQRLTYARLDFADGLARANAISGSTAAERIELLPELGVLEIRTRYSDGTPSVGIDSISGAPIVEFPPGAAIEPTLTTPVIAGAVAHADALAGPEWVAVEAWAELAGATTVAKVLLAHRTNGNGRIDLVATGVVTPGTEFVMLGSQSLRAAPLIARKPAVGASMVDALVRIEQASAGVGVNRIELELPTAGGLPALAWRVGVVNAAEIEQDAMVDATVKGAASAPQFTAPLHRRAADLNRDSFVNALDLAEVLAAWGVANPLLDLNHSGSVDAGDLSIVLGGWG